MTDQRISRRNRGRTTEQVHKVQSVEITGYMGPTPPASEVAELEAIKKGLGELVLNRTFVEQEHRHDLESRDMSEREKYGTHTRFYRSCGQAFGFILAVMVVGAGFGFAWLGSPAYGTTLIVFGIGVITLSFVYGARASAVVAMLSRDKSAKEDSGDGSKRT